MTHPSTEGGEGRAPRAALRVQPADALGRTHVSTARATSDQTRFRGVWVVCVLVVVASVVGWWITVDGDAERRSGALGIPHQRAGLACESCHVETETPAAAACVGCHGPHPSTRPGHQTARASGAMRCVSCHRIHQDAGGVVFDGEGKALRFGPGTSVAADAPLATPPGVVAVIPSAACQRCHNLDTPGDPLHRCVVGDSAGPSRCFDEHVAVRGATLGLPGGAQDRIPLWQATASILDTHPSPPSRPPASAAGALWGVVAVSLFVGISGWAWTRRERVAARSTTAPDVAPPTRRRLPQIDTHTCLGCSACIDACPYDVLALENFVAKLARPNDCCGLTVCEQRCPNGSLVIQDGPQIGDRPRVSATLESEDVPGLFLAGDLTGMPLIRNAINQGAVAAEQALRGLPPSVGAPEGVLDLIIVGAGPAGLSAALAAKAQGARFAVLEQGTVAHSIRSFPRGKLVFDQPLDVPLVGEMWLAETTKEELLRQWTRIVRTHKLPILEGRRVLAVQGHQGAFEVRVTHDGGETTMAARRVVLASGRRGTPRKLPIPICAEMEAHVHYAMADARAFAGQRVLVVGLGDVAMEAATALAHQPGTTVTVLARGASFRRGKARNIAAMQRAADAGRLRMLWEAKLQSLAPGRADVSCGPDGTQQQVDVDAVFVMIGSVAPWAFLNASGIRRASEAEKTTAEDRPQGADAR